jgi:glycosyltransferase involved in cell wall biosynthesis
MLCLLKDLGKKMISVICSVRNGARHLERYLWSLNTQCLQQFEIIFLDSASTDNTFEVLCKYSFRPGIKKRVIRSEHNITIYAAWNRMINEASGQWIINYNVDDYLFRETLRLLSVISEAEKKAEVIYGACLFSYLPCLSGQLTYKSWPDANRLESHIEGCCCGPFPLVSRNIYEKYGLFKESYSISGDYEMWTRLYGNGVIFKKMEVPLGIYYLNPEGLSTRKDLELKRKAEDNLARKNLKESIARELLLGNKLS